MQTNSQILFHLTYFSTRDEVKRRHFTILVLPKAGCDCLVPPTLSVTARTLPLLSPTPPSTGSTMATKIQFLRVAIKVAWKQHLLKDWIAYSSCAVYSLWPTKHLLSKNLKICVPTKSVEHLCQSISEYLLQKHSGPRYCCALQFWTCSEVCLRTAWST